MYNVIRENREMIEREFIALVLNKNEVVDLLQIKPKFLLNTTLQKILEYSIECYKENKVIMPSKIKEAHKDFNIAVFTDIMVNEMWYKNAWKEQLAISQDSILKFYKEDVIEVLNQQLKDKKINYDKFMEKMKQIDDVQLLENTQVLTESEIMNSINEEVSKIHIRHFEKLSNTLKLVQGDFLIIGATTGAGKSGFMLNLMNDFMKTYQCIYFNMEMSKSTIYKRLISINADLKIEDVEKPRTEHQKGLIEDAVKEIESNKLVVEHKANDISTIKSIIAKMKNKERHTILFIDHLGLCKVDGAKSLYEQATEVAKELRQICLEYDCTVVSASQLNRSATMSEQITLSMLKDSGELENSASKVIMLYKASGEDRGNLMMNMVVDIAKNRDGYTGIVDMIYDKEKQIFKEK